MRVALLSSEAVPFAKTGGLGDVAGALPRALREHAGTDALLILPLYESIDRRLLQNRIIDNLEVSWPGGSPRYAGVWYSNGADNSSSGGTPTFLIDAPEYFARPGIYSYRDDHERFAFFSRAALSLLRRLGAPPDVIHGNDWQCGFAAAELRTERGFGDFYHQTRTLFSIHNLAYQGAFDSSELARFGYDERAQQLFMWHGSAVPLKAGLIASDALSTVSGRYAREIQTSEQGYGLDELLRARRDRLVGITNGIDDTIWNPATDPHLAANYTADDLTGKQLCKLDLLRRFGLPEDVDRPVVATISRLVAQKGYDLIREAADGILQTGAYFIALGAGASEYEDFLQSWRDYAPQQVGIYKGYASESLAHQIEAGADIFLMPSLYEPCGLNQMYSMRYGTVPVVRATGGLDDTVENFDRTRLTGTGFKFEEYSSGAMLESLYEALYCYAEPEVWSRIQRNGMLLDNSWRRVANRYAELYQALIRL